MEERLQIIGGLVREYSTVWLVQVPEMKLVLYENTHDRVIEESITYSEQVNDYEKAFRYYADRHISGEDRESFLYNVSYETVSRQIEQMPVYKVDYIRHCDGKQEYYQISFARTVQDSENKNFVVGFKNIDTEAREREQRRAALEAALVAAEQANHSKTAFLNNISHDIRTPMNGIIGMTAIAAAHLDDPERVRECLDKITLASNHLVALINDVLDVSRIESGHVLLAKEPFRMSDQLENMVNMVTPQIQEKNQNISVDIHDVLHDHVIGDPLRLQQIFTNIVGNAVKYTPEGGQIKIALWEDTEDVGDYSKYIFTCEDNGYGMTREFVNKLFRPFERAEDERLKHVQGTGLGMTITQNLIRMMNGTIKVESEYGIGSRFTVTVCLRQQDVISEDAGAQPEQKVHAIDRALEKYSEKDYSGKRVLLAEDNELNMEIAREILEMTGAAVETAENGREALQMFEDHEPGYYDMIFMDIQMPVMDGYQATRAIRQLDRPDADLPVIAMSANAFMEDMESSRRVGMNDHIAKPISLPRLLGVMENYLDTRRELPFMTEELMPADHTAQAGIAPAKYYEELYFINGNTQISEDTERACINVLNKNSAVGIFGLLEQKDYPIYFVSGFALTLLGYTYEELMQESGGYFMDLVYEDDRKRVMSEFYDRGSRHQYRMIAKSGEIIRVSSYVADSYLVDGMHTRILSVRVETSRS